MRATMNDRGVITIPASLRRSFGLSGGDELILEETSEGILMRPSVNVPIEIYSEKRIQEFQVESEEIEALLETHD